jgi:hypothetical protein
MERAGDGQRAFVGRVNALLDELLPDGVVIDAFLDAGGIMDGAVAEAAAPGQMMLDRAAVALHLAEELAAIELLLEVEPLESPGRAVVVAEFDDERLGPADGEERFVQVDGGLFAREDVRPCPAGPGRGSGVDEIDGLALAVPVAFEHPAPHGGAAVGEDDAVNVGLEDVNLFLFSDNAGGGCLGAGLRGSSLRLCGRGGLRRGGRLRRRSGLRRGGRRGGSLLVRGGWNGLRQEILRGEQHQAHQAEGEQEPRLHAHLFAAAGGFLAVQWFSHPYSYFTGSKPPGHKGWQRASRFSPIQRPRAAP